MKTHTVVGTVNFIARIPRSAAVIIIGGSGGSKRYGIIARRRGKKARDIYGRDLIGAFDERDAQASVTLNLEDAEWDAAVKKLDVGDPVEVRLEVVENGRIRTARLAPCARASEAAAE